MNLKLIKRKFFTVVKIISTVLITSAIGLESWNIYAVITNNNVPSSLNPIFWIERFAMASHFIEAIIAARWPAILSKLS